MAIRGVFYGMKMVIITGYAPTEMAERNVKLAFYTEVDQYMQSIPADFRNHVVLLGDFNARIGAYLDTWAPVRGIYGSGTTTNENGQLLLALCARHGLLITNTMFNKKNYGTWKHPRSKKWHTLDYCIIHQSLKWLAKNCGIEPAIDCNSDHIPVQLTLKVHRNSRGKPRDEKGTTTKVPKLDFGKLTQCRDTKLAVGRRMDEQIARQY